MTVHPWARELGLVEAHVECHGSSHLVTWDPDLGLTFPDHPSIEAELALLALGAGAGPGCVEVAGAWGRIVGTNAALRGWRPPEDESDSFVDRGNHLASLVGVRPSAVAGSLRALRATPRPDTSVARPLSGFAAHLDHLVDQYVVPAPLRACLGVLRLADVEAMLDGPPPQPGRDPAASDARFECRGLAEDWARWSAAQTAPFPDRGRRMIEVAYDGPAEAALEADNAGRDLKVRLEVGRSWITSMLRRGIAVIDGLLVLDATDAIDPDVLDVGVVRWTRTRGVHRAAVSYEVARRGVDGWRLR